MAGVPRNSGGPDRRSALTRPAARRRPPRPAGPPAATPSGMTTVMTVSATSLPFLLSPCCHFVVILLSLFTVTVSTDTRATSCAGNLLQRGVCIGRTSSLSVDFPYARDYSSSDERGRTEYMVEPIIEELKSLILMLEPSLTSEQLHDDTAIVEDLGLDSILVVTLINMIEDRFAFTFAEDDLNMDTFANIRFLAEFISTRRSSEEDSQRSSPPG